MKRKANPGFDPDPGFEKSFPGSRSGSRINRDPGINFGIAQGPDYDIQGGPEYLTPQNLAMCQT